MTKALGSKVISQSANPAQEIQTGDMGSQGMTGSRLPALGVMTHASSRIVREEVLNLSLFSSRVKHETPGPATVMQRNDYLEARRGGVSPTFLRP